jgi:hypothetical protein
LQLAALTEDIGNKNKNVAATMASSTDPPEDSNEEDDD